MASRVPAWKRLGLKLKSEPVPEPEDNTPDVPIHTYDSVAPPTSAIPVTRKRSRSPEVASSKAPKKAKKALKSSDPADREQSPRKAVAFAPDAKIEDGDSIKQLFGAWVAERKQNDPTFVSVKDKQPASEPYKVSQTTDDNLTNKERRVQKLPAAKPVKSVLTKLAKPIKPPKIPKGQKPKPFEPALVYLKTFDEDKANWKFNKINQTLILKNAFDTTLIPADHNKALIAYIAGLKGLGRIHLRDRALEIRDQDVEDGINGFPGTMDDREKRQEEYDAAVAEYAATRAAEENVDENTSLEEGILMGLNPHQAMKSRIEKRMRVERILQTLASTPGDPTDYVPPKANLGPFEQAKSVTLEEAAAAAGPVKKVRNRKKRTEIVESDSSSSDDSSDSDSDSEDEAPAKVAKKEVAKKAASDSSDSDSSKSSFSSDSDSDEASSDGDLEDSNDE